MELTMLGTGCAVVSECYNTCFVLREKEDVFLVDGGGGSQILQQLSSAHVDLSSIRSIFVTHKHIDHLLGLIWVIRILGSAKSTNADDRNVIVYGHDEVIGILETMCRDLLHGFSEERVVFHAVKDREKAVILGHQVTFFDIHSSKAKQFGFCMELDEGKRLTCLGDEPYNPVNREYVESSTWLMHEAFCLASEEEIFRPHEKSHSTVKDASMTAQSLHVENLILYHTEDTDIRERKKRYGAEGRSFYSGNLYIPDDLETIVLQ